eukprot:TRINITY_DN8433_c0_g1_i7.p3 TRINITY_DN8433_c0_g1~~TRINITY_DN8433_c0_g1_i7.p3  ORF type:complete len:108 (-),score=11.28 TRINITY_DN8433_c0_g1_i7:70-393(-)
MCILRNYLKNQRGEIDEVCLDKIAKVGDFGVKYWLKEGKKQIFWKLLQLQIQQLQIYNNEQTGRDIFDIITKAQKLYLKMYGFLQHIDNKISVIFVIFKAQSQQKYH